MDLAEIRARAAEHQRALDGGYRLPPTVSTKPQEHVYAILRRDTNEVKIGRSFDVGRRMADLQHAHGEPLELLLSIRGNRVSEGHLHRRFAALRKRGEWFHYGDAIRAWVEERQS